MMQKMPGQAGDNERLPTSNPTESHPPPTLDLGSPPGIADGLMESLQSNLPRFERDNANACQLAEPPTRHRRRRCLCTIALDAVARAPLPALDQPQSVHVQAELGMLLLRLH